MEKTIKLLGHFDTLEIEVSNEIKKIPSNANIFHSVNNCYCYTNHNYIFFRGLNTGRMYRCKWTIELENQIKSVI